MSNFLSKLSEWQHVTNAYAQDLIPCADGTMADPSIGCVTTPASVMKPETGIAELLLQIAGTFMGIVAAVSAIMLIVSGIQYAMAAGQEQKIQKAKRIMLWSVLGLVVALLARTVTQFLLGTIV